MNYYFEKGRPSQVIGKAFMTFMEYINGISPKGNSSRFNRFEIYWGPTPYTPLD